IWRVVYRGDDRPTPTLPDLTKDGFDQLISHLSNPNITVRVFATHELVDRFGEDCASTVRSMMEESGSTPLQRVHGMWVLERLNKLDDFLLGKLLDDDQAEVRVHAIRVLAERDSWDKSPLPVSPL